MITDWQRVKRVLADAAAQKTAADRAAFLDGACGDDVEFRTQVEQLLRAHDEAGAFLEAPAIPLAEVAGGPPGVLLTEKTGDRIGPYKLLQQIGEGGCGIVYMAEQEQPIRRRVALKIIKLGMDTRAVIARFEAERQALALMDHPNIARVLDAGATDTGRPYFVMELVRGIKITDYCDENHLPTVARLQLFAQVCHALQHAHQKGIIHRDIKPSNILVTMHDGAPMPKVIDFGIAKATDQRLTDKTLFTAFEQFIGTPAYMSPEQAQMSKLDIDTRSDVYALGVLLYELLTGQTPFDQQKLIAAGLDEMRRIIREEEPVRPSTRLSTLTAMDRTSVARSRQVEAPQLIHRLRGDLDWIVMRCLEKDRTRRYGTANSLADDVVRHLNSEPVSARPPSRLYRLERLVRRNKGTFVTGGVVAIALLLGLGFSLWTLVQEREARRQTLAAEQKAQAEAGKSQQVAEFLKEMLRGAGPSVALGRDTTMLREILDRTAGRVGRDLKGQPEVEAELRTTLGQVYEALGRYDAAEGMYREALRLRRGLWGEMNTNVADALDRLGYEMALGRGEAVESAALIAQALAIRTNLLGSEHVQVGESLAHLGKVHLYLNELNEAADLYQRSLAMKRRLLGNEHPGVAELLTILADTFRYQHRPKEAEALAREALAILTRLAADEPATLGVAAAREALAGALSDLGQMDEALNLLGDVATARMNLLGPDHPEYASAAFNLGKALVRAGRLDEGESKFRDALEVCKRTVRQEHTLTAFCLEELGQLLCRTGRLAEAEAALREALEMWKSRENHHVRRLRLILIGFLRRQGKLADAEALMSAATAEATTVVEAARRLPPSEAGINARLRLAEVLWCTGRIAESEPLLGEVMEVANQLAPSAVPVEEISVQAMRNAALEVWFGREAEHAALCRWLVPWAEAQQRFVLKGRAAAMVGLRPVADLQIRTTALALARQAATAAPANALIVWYRLTLGVAEYRLGHYPEAERILRSSEQDGPHEWHPATRTGTSKFFRAMMLFRQGQPDVARRLFAEAEAETPPLPEALEWTLSEGADFDDLMVWLACKEARALIKPPSN
jgi:serine/threonine protein kinase/tetratricopeptide (TPR) repeat protein